MFTYYKSNTVPVLFFFAFLKDSAGAGTAKTSGSDSGSRLRPTKKSAPAHPPN